MKDNQPVLGFVGLGLMGTPMCRNLLAKGFTVHVWNRSVEKATLLGNHGAVVSDSLKTLVKNVDVIILSLTDTEAVQHVVFGHHGVASQAAQGKILIDTSSISPDATRQFAKQLESANGMTWVDAPVSGGVKGAENASLSFMIGGDQTACATIQPILDALGRNTTRMGDSGAGQTTKVFNQMIVGCNAVAIAEMMALAARTNVDATKIAEALSGGFADSKPLQLMAPRMANHEFEPVQWHVATLIKDLSNAMTLADDFDQPAEFTKLALSSMLKRGEANMNTDLSTLVKVFEQNED